MTRPMLLAVLLFLNLHSARAQAGNDLAIEGLRGRVKTVTEIEYTDEAMRKPFMKTQDTYDTKGNLVETIHNDFMLKLDSRKYVKYDTDHYGAVVTRKEYEDTGILMCTVTYKYDTLWYPVEEEEHRYYDGKEKVSKVEYYYDEQGKKVQEKNYTNGAPDHNTLYVFDKKGRVSESKTYYGGDKPVMAATYYYFSGDQWVECEKQNKGVRTHVFRTLDSAGRLLKKTTYLDDYSKQTNETNLKFDKYGNWLTQSVEGTISESYFISRTIEYYK